MAAEEEDEGLQRLMSVGVAHWPGSGFIAGEEETPRSVGSIQQ
jgi:hypothetical protein